MKRIIVTFVTLFCLVTFCAPRAQSAEAETMAQKGIRLYEKKDYSGALKAFAIAKPANIDARGYLTWGLAAYQSGKYQSATIKLERAASMGPPNGTLQALLGHSYLKMHDFNNALKHYRLTKGTDRYADSTVAYQWGYVAYALGKDDEATTQLLRSRQLGAVGTEAFQGAFVLAHLHLRAKDFEKVRAETLRALAIRKDFQPALVLLGEAELRLGNVERAVELLTEGVVKKPKDVAAHYNLASALARQGKRAAACKRLAAALALNPLLKKAAKTDSDFDAIRKESCFTRLLD